MSKVATVDPEYSALVVLPGGKRMTRQDAEASGFTIEAPLPADHEQTALNSWIARQVYAEQLGASGRPATESVVHRGRELSAADQNTMIDRLVWEHAILNSPEGKARPAAAKQLCHSSDPVIRDAKESIALLRGLKEETTAAGHARRALGEGLIQGLAEGSTNYVAGDDEARVRRMVEIRVNMLSMKRDSRGDRAAGNECRQLSGALREAVKSNRPIKQVMTEFGIDPSHFLH